MSTSPITVPFQGADDLKSVCLARKRSVFASIALLITAFFMGATLIAWVLFLVDLPLLYKYYDILVMLVWDYPRLAAIITLYLIAKAGPHRFAKLAKIGACVLAILMPGFWIHWGGRLPISHLVKHYSAFAIHILSDQPVEWGGHSNRDREVADSKLWSATLVPVSRPDHPADGIVIFFVEDRYADITTRTLHLGAPLDSEYICRYYSKEGILADDRSQEYVRVPVSFCKSMHGPRY